MKEICTQALIYKAKLALPVDSLVSVSTTLKAEPKTNLPAGSQPLFTAANGPKPPFTFWTKPDTQRFP